MSTDSEFSGDYGYDLAQEVRGAVFIPMPRRPNPVISIHGVPFDRDRDGEMGVEVAPAG